MSPFRTCSFSGFVWGRVFRNLSLLLAGFSVMVTAQFASIDLGGAKAGKTIYDAQADTMQITGYGYGFGYFIPDDVGRFVYVPMTGDFDVSLRIKKVKENESHTTPWEVILMARKTLLANSIWWGPRLMHHGWENEYITGTDYRLWPGATIGGSSGGFGCEWLRLSGEPGPCPNFWLRLRREGDKFHFYYKTNSATAAWTETEARTMSFGTTAYVGIAISTDVDRTNTTGPIVASLSELQGFSQSSGVSANSIKEFPKSSGTLSVRSVGSRTFNISYVGPELTGRVRIDIYNIQGIQVRTFLNATTQSNAGSIVFDGCDNQGRALPAGTYVFNLEAHNALFTSCFAVK